MPLVEQELLTLPEHMSSLPVLSEVRVTRSLLLCECFVDRCLSLCTFSFGICVVRSSSIYTDSGYILLYLQTLLKQQSLTKTLIKTTLTVLMKRCTKIKLRTAF